jgi:hypothetical protein
MIAMGEGNKDIGYKDIRKYGNMEIRGNTGYRNAEIRG